VQLGELSEALTALLVAIKAGKWDQFAELADQMAQAMDAVQNTVVQQHFNAAAYRSRIEAILAMLESAIHECSTRKDQLLPLIDALNRISTKSGQP